MKYLDGVHRMLTYYLSPRHISIPRQPVGEPCVSLRTFARAVGGRAWGSGSSAAAIGIWRNGGRVLVDGHFLPGHQQPCCLRRDNRKFAGQAGE